MFAVPLQRLSETERAGWNSGQISECVAWRESSEPVASPSHACLMLPEAKLTHFLLTHLKPILSL